MNNTKEQTPAIGHNHTAERIIDPAQKNQFNYCLACKDWFKPGDGKPKAEKLYRDAQDMMIYLYGRWQDEKEYENIDDYVKPLNGFLEKYGATNVKMSKRPFGFTCMIDGKSWRYSATSRTYSLTELSVKGGAQ